MTRTLFIFLFAAFLAAGCGGKDKRALADYAARQDRTCPIPADSTMVLVSVAYDDDDAVLVLRYNVDETNVTVAEMKRADRQLRKAIASGLQSDDSGELLQMLADGDAALRLDFSGKITGDVFGISFTPEQIRKIADLTPR